MSRRAIRRRRRRRIGLLIAVVGTAVEGLALRRRGYGLAGEVVVRCRDGHLFTTLWVPGVSFKALRFGPSRFQRCPVGGHWSLVTPVALAELSPEEQRLARERQDVRIP
jgi:hypothetical protein